MSQRDTQAAEMVQANPYVGTSTITIDTQGIGVSWNQRDNEVEFSIPLVDNTPLVAAMHEMAKQALPGDNPLEQDRLADAIAEVIYRTQLERFLLRRIRSR